MIEAIKKVRVLYVCVWVLAAFMCVLEETNVLPKGFLQSSPQTDYVLHMICVVLTLSVTWGGLRLFAFKSIRAKLEQNPMLYPMLNVVRIGIVALVLFVDLFIYYALMSGTTPLFCMLIALVALLFCWPAGPLLTKFLIKSK